MSLKLNSSGGGSVTLQEPTTASNVTLSLPAADGTVVYENSSGNVGIGTSSPTTMLHLSGSAAAGKNTTLTLENTTASTGRTYQIISGDGGPFRIQDVTAGAERARIDSSGTFLVGQTTNPATSTMVIKVPTGSANGVNAQITSNTGTSYPWSNYNATGTYVGGISCTSTATAFPTSSDYRLKEDIQPMQNALAIVAALKPVTYKWKLDGSDGQGFIAHELQEVCPDAVVGEKDAVNEDGSIKPQGIDTSFLVATLTAAIQELKAEVDALRAQVEAQ